MADDHFIERNAGEPPRIVEYVARQGVEQSAGLVVVALHDR